MASAAPHRILLADDDRLILATMGQGLRDAGYEVLEATDGRAAINLCECGQPDLAILDVRMPGISGVEAARLIRQKTNIPFIFLSAYGDKEIVQLAVEEGALAYIVKPVDVTQMVPSIEAALARAAELSSLRESERKLISSLKTNRATSMAIGLIMERLRLDRHTAFEVLRKFARSEQRKTHDVAEILLHSVDKINNLHRFLPDVPGKSST